jgi:DNA-binding response OmpR family regulator
MRGHCHQERETLYAGCQEMPAIILLDIMAPKMTSYDFIKTYRKESKTHFILPPATFDESDKAMGLDFSF